MSYLKAESFSGSECCSRCNKSMDDDAENPAIIFKEYTPENGRVQIWAHIECVQQLIYNVRRRAAIAKLATEVKQ